jgi:hypothetical protein
VPNAALRFRPTADMFAALNQAVPPELTGGRGRSGRPAAGAEGAGAPSAPGGARGAAGAQGASNAPAGAAGAQVRGAPGAEGARGAEGAPGAGAWQGRGGQGDAGDRRARMLERFKTISPDEQQQFIARMKERGIDTSAFEQAKPAPAAPKPGAAKGGSAKPGKTKAEAETIDALFAPLAPTESAGRAWLYVDKQLKPVRLRLGITDGQYTELLSGELQPGMELVTSILGAGTTRMNPTGSGNPLMGPQRGMRGR